MIVKKDELAIRSDSEKRRAFGENAAAKSLKKGESVLARYQRKGKKESNPKRKGRG